MVEFLPCRDPVQIKVLCRQAQVAHTPAVHAYTAVENEEQIGFGLFELAPARVSILHIPNDDYLADVLTRSAMNYALLQGIELVSFQRANNIPLLQALEFVKDDINEDAEIKSFFRGCRNCAKTDGKPC